MKRGLERLELRNFEPGGFSPTPLKNDGLKVSWDDDMNPIYGKIKAMFQTINQEPYPCAHDNFDVSCFRIVA